MPHLQPSICIVGAGAAGLTLANTLARQGWRVTIVEGGTSDSVSGFTDLTEVQVVGTPHRGVTEGRFRGWGGSTTRWGGQLWAWEPHEFAPREHLGLGGWPISAQEVLPRTAEAFRLLGLRGGALTRDEALSLGVQPVGLSADEFFLKFSTSLPWRKRNLGRTVGAKLRRQTTAKVYFDTTATRVITNRAGTHATGVHIRGNDGSETLLPADLVVIAAGAIETARILLGTEEAFCEARGRWSWLGRGFMDHLSVRTARLRPRDTRDFQRRFAPVFAHGAQHMPRIVLRERLLETQKLLGCYGHWEVRSPAGSTFSLLRGKLRGFQSGRMRLSASDARQLAASLRGLSRLAVGAVVDHRRYFEENADIYLRVDTEQQPDPESQIIPVGGYDSLGLPRVALDWRVSPLDRRTVTRAAALLRAELERLDIGSFEAHVDPFDPTVPWGDLKGDSFHMMGGTRMAAHEEGGVVDTHGRVFGIDNLFVASTSQYPTGGMANPTLLLICLTLRLADYLTQSA